MLKWTGSLRNCLILVTKEVPVGNLTAGTGHHYCSVRQFWPVKPVGEDMYVGAAGLTYGVLAMQADTSVTLHTPHVALQWSASVARPGEDVSWTSDRSMLQLLPAAIRD